MTLNEGLTITALLISPIIAVLITLWHDGRKEKRAQKQRTFFTLVALRDSFPIHQDFANALNTLDIVFHDCPKVLEAWKKYYESLSSGGVKDFHAQNRLKLDLLLAIATVLGYKNWKQTEMDTYYIPVQHFDQSVLNGEIQKELLSFLKNSNRLYEAHQFEQAASKNGNS